MKVCHLTSVHQRYDTRIFIKECKTLYEAGYDVSLIVADGKGDEQKDGIKIYDVGKPISRWYRMRKTTKKVFNKAIELDAQIYHFHDPELIPVGLKLRNLGKKVIYDVHEDVPRQILYKPYLNKILRKAVSKIFEKYELNTIKIFSAIVCATDVISKRFIDINSKTIVVKNYPQIEFLPEITDILQRPNNVVYIGLLNQQRGTKEIVKASKYLKENAKINIAGIFSNKNYQQQIQALPEWNNIVFHGFLNKDEIYNLLNNAKIGLVPLYNTQNYRVSLPVKLFEYMSLGLAVIGTKGAKWSKIIEQEKCGITVDPTSPEEIAKAIKTLLNDQKRLKVMSQNAVNAIRTKYNWNVEKKKLLSLYDSFNHKNI